MDDAVNCWCNEVVNGLPINRVTSYTAIAMTGFHKLGMVGAYRAIADFSPGPRIATNLPSVHWHKERIAGAAKKKGGRLIGISGQVASDGDRNIVARGDPAAQARYCFSQIRGVLEKHGASLEDVVEITSFHKDPRRLAAGDAGRRRDLAQRTGAGLDTDRLHRPLHGRLSARDLRLGDGLRSV